MRPQRLLMLLGVAILLLTGCGTLPDPVPAPYNPLLSDTNGPFVDPNSVVAQWVRANPNHPLRAEIEQNIASQPVARWMVGSLEQVEVETDSYVTAASKANRMPIVVADQLPGPRCAPEHPGLPDAQTYRAWVTNLAAGIAGRSAIVILEPNSLQFLDCLSPPQQQARFALLRDAVTTLTGGPLKAAVLLGGGDGRSVPAPTMAQRLQSAGIDLVPGFAVNVGSHNTNQDARAYGSALRDELERLTGRRDYYMAFDTSRNGNGPRPVACNPAGAKLGRTTQLGGSVRDGQPMWITTPGVSDGDCGIAPGTVPGQFVPELAHRLIAGT